MFISVNNQTPAPSKLLMDMNPLPGYPVTQLVHAMCLVHTVDIGRINPLVPCRHGDLTSSLSLPNPALWTTKSLPHTILLMFPCGSPSPGCLCFHHLLIVFLPFCVSVSLSLTTLSPVLFSLRLINFSLTHALFVVRLDCLKLYTL